MGGRDLKRPADAGRTLKVGGGGENDLAVDLWAQLKKEMELIK